MLHTKFRGNRPTGSGEKILKRFEGVSKTYPQRMFYIKNKKVGTPVLQYKSGV